MVDEDRRQRIVQAVDRLIEPGEVWVVRKEGTGVVARVSGQSDIALTNPELYGRLLRVNSLLCSAGGAICIWMPLLVLLCCVGLHLGLFEPLWGNALDRIRSVWFYIAVLIISFFLSGGLARAWERIKYRRFREPLMEALRDAEIPPHRLIAEIERDEALDHLSDQLKSDPRIV
jgi:hypothetical protein